MRRVIPRLDRGLLALAHYEPDVYRDGFELMLCRVTVHPKDVWQVDPTKLDVQVVDESSRVSTPAWILWCGAGMDANGGSK